MRTKNCMYKINTLSSTTTIWVIRNQYSLIPSIWGQLKEFEHNDKRNQGLYFLSITRAPTVNLEKQDIYKSQLAQTTYLHPRVISLSSTVRTFGLCHNFKVRIKPTSSIIYYSTGKKMPRQNHYARIGRHHVMP